MPQESSGHNPQAQRLAEAMDHERETVDASTEPGRHRDDWLRKFLDVAEGIRLVLLVGLLLMAFAITLS